MGRLAVELRSGAGSIPASSGISQTVGSGDLYPGTSSSPCARRYPCAVQEPARWL